MINRRTRANGEGSIFPYRNGYAAYVWVNKSDGTRGRKWAYGKTREEVHHKWLKLHQQAQQGPVATRVPTLGEYLAYWLSEVVKPNLAPGTYVTYEVIARRYLVPGLGNKRIDKLQPRDVQTWLNLLRTECQCCRQGKDARRAEDKRRCCALGRCCQDRLSAVTVVNIRRILRAALSQAVTDELVSRNVARFVKLPSVRVRRRQSWSSEEARRFLESALRGEDPSLCRLRLGLGARSA